ncbi:MAG: hypothetical protein NTV52_21615 [Acidobacteria bacterium]|nr:hypothetical protein [Acidobacteriota bacterium]
MVHRIAGGWRFRVVFGRGKFGWQQAEQGGDGTRQTEDWTAVATEERVMMWFVGPCPAGGWATGPAAMLYGKWRSMAALPIPGTDAAAVLRAVADVRTGFLRWR